MEPVIVIAAPERSPLETTLNPRQSQLPVPASDATDLLKTVPGFSAVRSGGANGDPVFRGMFGSRINILTNGSNMSGACPNRMDAPSSYISPDLYDRVTIIKGPQTVLWGGGTSAATIRFDRLPERFTEPGARFRAGVFAGSYGHFEEYVDAAAGTEKVYARINVNYSTAGMGMMGADSTVKNIDAQIMGTELGASYLFFDHWRLSGSLAYAWGENTDDGRPMPQIPPLEGRLGASYETETWQAGVLWFAAAGLAIFDDAGNLESSLRMMEKEENSPLYSITRRAVREFNRINKTGDAARLLNDNVRRALHYGIDEEMARLKSSLAFLATTANTAPFIGLFGTVWGIMYSFQAIAQMKSVSIATVAPGIAEALIATAVGLFVAIPATCGYNTFRAKLAAIEGLCITFAGQLLNRM